MPIFVVIDLVNLYVLSFEIKSTNDLFMNKLNSTAWAWGVSILSFVGSNYAPPAQAITLNVGGQDFEFVNISTTFEENNSILFNLPWVIDNSLLVEDFAVEAFEAFQDNPSASLGFPNGNLGPFFPLGFILESFPVQIPSVTYDSSGSIISQTTFGNETVTYAVVSEVTPIPEPNYLSGLVILSGLGFVSRVVSNNLSERIEEKSKKLL